MTGHLVKIIIYFGITGQFQKLKLLSSDVGSFVKDLKNNKIVVHNSGNSSRYVFNMKYFKIDDRLDFGKLRNLLWSW